MKFVNAAFLFCLIFVACQKNNTVTIADMLQNEKGWYAYQYKRVDIGKDAEFISHEPYIIIGEYGSGFKIKENGDCYINYSDGSIPIEESTIIRKWEIINNNEIHFISQSVKDVNATIVELTDNFLWIEYEASGDKWEYKMKRIE